VKLIKTYRRSNQVEKEIIVKREVLQWAVPSLVSLD
jgi:hypothetical protein